MFKDELRNKVWNEIRQLDLQAFGEQLTPQVFDEAAQRAGVRVGRSALNLANLVWLGIRTAMHHTGTFAFILTSTLKLLEDQAGFHSTPVGEQKKQAKRKKKGKGKSKHHPHRHDPTEVTEEAFVQARQRMPLAFWAALVMLLAERFQREHAPLLNVHGFRLLAMDGTTLGLPNVQRLRQHYGMPKNGARRKAAPQARMVMLTLPRTRIPIAYEVSPLATSELELSRRLLKHVRAQDLILMDRGFFSYGLFWEIQGLHAYFGTRLKKGIKYRKVKQLGTKDWLVEWTPRGVRSKWKGLPQSIRLRVIHYQIPGFRASAIVTNVLNPRRLTRKDWVQLAQNCDDNGKFTPGLYHQRWEIETSYFELKVVLKTKSLRSRTPASVEYELAGRVVYYLLIRWLIVRAAEKHGLDPLRISFSNAVRELELMWSALVTGSERWVQKTLLPRLLDRIASHLVPLRPGRHYPRKNDTKSKDRGKGQKQPPAKLSNRINSNHKNKKRKAKNKA